MAKTAAPAPSETPGRMGLTYEEVDVQWHLHIGKVEFNVDGAFFKELIQSFATFGEALGAALNFWGLTTETPPEVNAALGDLTAIIAGLGRSTLRWTGPVVYTVGAPPVDYEGPTTPPYNGVTDSWGVTPP